MDNQNRNKKLGGGSLFGFLNSGWGYVGTPSKSRCDAYEKQFNYAQEQMQRDDLSRKEKKFWRKERNAAMAGFADVHNKNHEFVKGLACVLVVGAVAYINLNKK